MDETILPTPRKGKRLRRTFPPKKTMPPPLHFPLSFPKFSNSLSVCRRRPCRQPKGYQGLSNIKVRAPQHKICNYEPPHDKGNLPNNNQVNGPPSKPHLPPQVRTKEVPNNNENLLPKSKAKVEQILITRGSSFPKDKSKKPI